MVALAALSLVPAEEPCRFPSSWIDQWYWKDSVFNITEDQLGTQGRCVQQQRDTKFLLQRDIQGQQSCYICVVMFERHTNIIEFKQSRYCSPHPSLRQVCRSIGADAPLNTMIRVRPTPVPCPFRGRFTFNYRRSDRVCADPVSRAWSCADPWSLVLQHQACPDVAGAERLSETLTCLATWRNHDTHFMFGKLNSVKTKTDADRYRCFIYQPFDLGGGQQGFHVVQSGDSTCQGLQSVHVGHKVMNLTNERRRLAKCRLPEWLTAHHEWHRMDSRLRFHIFHKNHSIKVSHEQGPGQERQDDESTKLICSQITELSENSAQVVFHHSRGCTSGYQCAVLYRRDRHVVEIKLGDVVPSPEAACQFFDETRHNFTTLVAASHPSHPCPYLGRHAVIGVQREGRRVRDACSGAFSTLVMGCHASDTLELRSECRQRTESSEYRCHGSWQENNTHFLVASPLSRSSPSARRVCFISMATGDGLHFSTLQEACYRSVLPGQEGSLAFNVTINGDCRAEATDRSL
ncbi:uncharacterized protein LOC122376299 isoform X2 [Amphibalanus amphitrite]|uniref:uncharacterized protein LOC122376299 isoform X2 n=1 Tax=Amphibalanus amphitrite TaxID=1232801 RepID=UPI001C8FF319|nr:uncharacterized protein LOC122376299 isoform X2 [Amphibalanus amphitrite]